METKGRIHSLEGQLDDITVIEKTGDNQYVVDYKGTRCSAIFNFFTGCYYVDDVYGVIK